MTFVTDVAFLSSGTLLNVYALHLYSIYYFRDLHIFSFSVNFLLSTWLHNIFRFPRYLLSIEFIDNHSMFLRIGEVFCI